MTCSEKTSEACGAARSSDEGDGASRAESASACELVGLDRLILRYRCRRPDDSALRQRLRELAAERRRFGDWRTGWSALAREGHALNHKKLYRLYREERLMVRRRRGRKHYFAHQGAAHQDQPALVARLRLGHTERRLLPYASSTTSNVSA